MKSFTNSESLIRPHIKDLTVTWIHDVISEVLLNPSRHDYILSVSWLGYIHVLCNMGLYFSSVSVKDNSICNVYPLRSQNT
jgi:hypothetical protein